MLTPGPPLLTSAGKVIIAKETNRQTIEEKQQIANRMYHEHLTIIYYACCVLI